MNFELTLNFYVTPITFDQCGILNISLNGPKMDYYQL